MAADDEVQLDWVSNDRDLLKSIVMQQKVITKNQLALAKMGNTGSRSFKRIQRDANQSTNQLMKFNTSMIGIGTVVGGILTVGRQINAEHKDLMRRNRESQVSSRTFGEQMRLTRIAFTEDDTLKNKDLEQVTQQVSKNTQTDANIIGDAMTDAFSAKGALTNQDAVNAIEAAFSLLPNNLDSGKTLASRAMDISNATGEKDMKAIVGFLQNIQNTARITTLEKVGRNLVPAINALKASGDTPEQAAEVVVTLTKLMSDAKGELSKTASINLATRLGNFVPDRKGKDKRGDFQIPQSQIDSFEAAKSTTERIDVLQKSPELRRDFIGNNPFAAESSEFVKMLLEGNKEAMAQFRATQKGINPLDANQVQAFNKKLTEISGGTFQAQVDAKERGDVNLQEFQLKDKTGQDIAAAEGILNQALGQVGLTERSIKEADFSWLRDGPPAEYAAGIVDSTIAGLTAQRGGRNGQPINLDVDNKINFLRSQKKVLEDLAVKQRQSRSEFQTKVAPESQVKQVKKILFDSLRTEGPRERTRQMQIFEQTRSPTDPASSALVPIQNLVQQFEEARNNQTAPLSPGQEKALAELREAIDRLSSMSSESRNRGQQQPQRQEQANKALKENTDALKANAEATNESNRLKAQEQQQKQRSSMVPPSRRAASQSTSESLSNTGP